MKLNQKSIILTGAGSGMGRQLALSLLDRGAAVIGIDINQQSLDETVALAGASGNRMTTYVLDITNREKVEATIHTILAEQGSVDGIINNAGIIQPFVRVNDLTFDKIERVMNVNFYGTLYLIKALLPHLLTRPEAHIVNVSSMGGFLPVPGQTIYGASKAAVKLLTEGLHSELVDTSVRVSVVFPGAVNTNITKNSGLADRPGGSENMEGQKILSAERAAGIILDGMEKNKYRIIVGSDSRFMDFFYRLAPARAARMIQSKMKDLLN